MVGRFVMTRWLPEHHHHPPLSSPVSRHSHRQLNFYIGIVLVVLMAVSVVALICCCYHLEWRLRLQARNAARQVNRNGNGLLGSHEVITRVGKKVKQVFLLIVFQNHSDLKSAPGQFLQCCYMSTLGLDISSFGIPNSCR